MNAKKIMGAVLVALLAAALFVGAGAAATVFIGQEGVSGYEGTWINGDSKVSIEGGIVSATTTFVPGIYTNGSEELNIQKPTVNFQLLGGESSSQYIVGTLIKGDKLNYTAKIPTTAGGSFTIAKIVLVQPNGEEVVIATGVVDSLTLIPVTYLEKAGKYSIYAIYDAGFVTGATPAMKTTTAVEFEVSSADAKLSVSVAEVTVGDVVKISIQGKPNTWYTVSGLGDFTPSPNQVYTPYVAGTGAYKIQTQNDGTVYFSVTADDDGTATLKLYEGEKAEGTSKGTVEIKVNAGTYTMVAEKDSVYNGNDVVLTVTVTGGDLAGANVVVEGPGNYKDTFTEKDLQAGLLEENEDGTYTITINTRDSYLGKMDVGTYTYTLVIGTGNDADEVASVSVDVIQPFLTAVVETPVVVEDGKLIVSGTAEATETLGYYIFGNNQFYNGTIDVEDDGTFEFKLDLKKAGLATGQYFLVVQHAMYDKEFNIAPVAGNIYKNISAQVDNAFKAGAWNGFDTLVVETSLRQNANGAEALCEELDSQGIDDIYVKATFIVDVPYSDINPIPSEVTKGTKIVISGQTNMPEGQKVKVTMASTAFGAVPKESNNAAAFISVVTETKADGTWEVTLDTSKLNLDDYSVIAEVNGFTSKAVTVKVVEGTPVTPTETQQPTQPTETQPTQTAAPETPGFGALAALAGLGAVAALLLRRE